MPWIQRSETGEIVGQFTNRQPGYAEVWADNGDPELSRPTPEQLAAAERIWRDTKIDTIRWLRERHRDELDIGIDTTLTDLVFSEFLNFIQELRDWPQSTDFPSEAKRPGTPAWLVDLGK
ncbi:MAG: phage tail assembly chaperone [Pseudomonas sp.]